MDHPKIPKKIQCIFGQILLAREMFQTSGVSKDMDDSQINAAGA